MPNVSIRRLDGGELFEGAIIKVAGAFPVIVDTRPRNVIQIMAVENRVKRKPQTIIIPIFAICALGRAGARGSMTRLGTKKTASQRVKKATAGLNNREFRRSTKGEANTRRQDIRVRRRSIDANGAGNAMLREARPIPTAR